MRFNKLIYSLATASVLLAVVFVFSPAHGQSNKRYYYQNFNVNAEINTDSTIDLTEELVYDFQGKFNAGWRSIQLDSIDSITNVQVIDKETNKPLIYSKQRLDKLDRTNWNKYTVFKDNGTINIEWYYNLANTQHTWIIKYKVHGAIKFGHNQNRWYWDIFTDFAEPVLESRVVVKLPKATALENVQQASYRNFDKQATQYYNQASNSFVFEAKNFNAQEDFTIDIGFPASIVLRSAYWHDYWINFYGIILSWIIAVLGIIIMFIRWLITEKFKKGRGVIIPQYEPPQNLRPAMAEIIATENLSDKCLAATIIDLAIRGYIKIEEDNVGVWDKIKAGAAIPKKIILITAGSFIVIAIVSNNFYQNSYTTLLSIVSSSLAFIMLVYTFLLFIGWLGTGAKKKIHYKLISLKDFLNDKGLEDFEKKYLHLLFETENTFSTFATRKWSSTKKRKFADDLNKLKLEIYKETENDTSAFEVGLSLERKKGTVILSIILGGLYILVWGDESLHINYAQWFPPIVVAALTMVAIWAFFKYEARLSASGRILKEDWLGFKMYLQTAERYRMQKLSPETFEKFLPYAMVFGIEKQWAKHFELQNINIPTPTWYVATGALTSPTGGTSNFSPSVFSSSFVSSFTSSFSSSAGTGVGGGGAGGGGGGGGGGAS